ncbi:S41 family peptidase [Helcococcus ovis]|uniref:S41 family peptidase n=1 Tax=Helcococcus ovis TaxID=72026 RepID=UPI00106FC97D|nr:S41 family peptidase [Helcococcus ovis]TFF68701.1 S41 family peptidase [Helcococcus ovis]WNZ01642.1 S41 family peptidase [Helcococcus ovis]
MNKKVKIIMYSCIVVLISLVSFNFGRKSMQQDIKNTTINSSKKEIKILNFDRVNKNISSLVDLIEIKYLHKFKYEDLEQGIYKGMIDSLKDQYSTFFNEEEFKELMNHTSGEFSGVGIQVGVSEDGYIEVIAPIKGSPADNAGVKPGDKISKINGEVFLGKDLNKAVKIMRGKEGESVVLTVKRLIDNKEQDINIKITRAVINLESVYPKMLDNNIGYVLVTNFQENTAKEFEKAIKDLKSQGAQKLILDLRNNPGGLLDSTVNIANMLMNKGILITAKDKNGNVEKYETKDGTLTDMPMVTLINKGSASASEVMSGALKDRKRSILVGENSYGKGVIQQIFPFNIDNKKEGLKITIAEFFTPNGNQINKKGIKPDYEVKIPGNVKKIGVDNLENDTQLQKAIELLK